MKPMKSLATCVLMGIPVWVILLGMFQSGSTSVVIRVDEPGVTAWVGDVLVQSQGDALEHGPIIVEPGEYPVRVLRDGVPVFETTVRVEPGERKEVWARWADGAAARDRADATAAPVTGLDAAERRHAGHYAKITSVGASGDGQVLLSAGADGLLGAWDASTGKPMRKVQAHIGPVGGMTVLADGRQAVTAGTDGFLRIWDVATGAEVRSLSTSLDSGIRCLAASWDGAALALGGDNGHVVVIELEDGAVRFRRSLLPDTPSAIAFAPDGHTLLVSRMGPPRSSRPVALWDASNGRTLRELQGHDGPVWALAFVPDSKHALTGGSDRTLRLWDLSTGREEKRFEHHPGSVLSVAVSPDGRFVLAGTGHRWTEGWRPADTYGAQLWDLEEGRAIGRLETPGPVPTVAFSPDGARVVAGGDDHVVRSWEIAGAMPIQRPESGPSLTKRAAAPQQSVKATGLN